MSWAALCTLTWPRGLIHTLAAAGATCVGYIVAAQPQPTSQSPSRIAPGLGSRRLQPNASAAWSKQAINDRLVYGSPLIGSRIVSLRRRNSIGSICKAMASSSIADSSANRYGTSGGERMKPGVLRSACTIDTFDATLGQA